MLLDADISGEVPDELSCQIVIVGAGTVGLFLAMTLAEPSARLDIIVVDSGPKVATTAMNAATATSIGKPHNGVLLGRATGLGGTSCLWGGQLAEFSQDDLERPDAPWLLSFEELQKYYRVVYQRLALGIPATAAIYRAQFGGETTQPQSIERFFTYWLEEPNFASFYRRRIQSEQTPRVIVNLTANEMAFEGENARSLQCISAAGRKITIRSRRFVFAAGTVATARFFLSAQRSGNVPWATNDNVGSYFQDHLGGKIAKVSVLDEKRFRNYFENGWVGGIKLQPKLTLSSMRRRTLHSGACCLFAFDSVASENIANIKRTIRTLRSGLSFSSVSSRFHDAFAVGRSMLPIVLRYARSRRVFALFDRGVYLHVQAEQIPFARSRIRLVDAQQAADGLVPVSVDWRCDGRELAAIYDLAIESDIYLRNAGLAALTLDSALQARDAAFLEGLEDTYHPCGGMRMSGSATSGVVDADCKVWGTNNVWVAGAAVFPSSSHANCTLTALALAARLAPRLQ